MCKYSDKNITLQGLDVICFNDISSIFKKNFEGLEVQKNYKIYCLYKLKFCILFYLFTF